MVFDGPGMKNTNVSVVKAKREFSELLGRASVGKETFTITHRGFARAQGLAGKQRSVLQRYSTHH